MHLYIIFQKGFRMFVTINLKNVLTFLAVIITGVISAFGMLIVSGVANANTGVKINYTIAVDAGHGGIDGGSVGVNTKVTESELNLKIAKALKVHLESFGFNVVLTRENENGLYSADAKNLKKDDMEKRKKIITENKADMLVSIHMNSFSTAKEKGAQAFYYEGHENSKNLADCIQEQLFKNVPLAREHSNFGDYYILNCLPIPSVIVECGFLSNPENEELLIKESHQKLLAYNIFCGIVKYFNLTQSVQ